MAAVAHAVAPPHPHHAPLSLMSCVSRGVPSPLTSPRASPRASRTSPHCGRHADPAPGSEDDARHESKKRSFHPLRGLRRMFRRKARGAGASAEASATTPVAAAGGDDDLAQTAAAVGDLQLAGHPAASSASNGAPRSASTGRLLSEGPAASKDARRTAGGLYPGLSVSHDSVFTADPSDQSGSDTTSTQSIQRIVLPGVRAELVDALRRRNERGKAGKAGKARRGGRGGRGDTSEDDEDLGLPRSPDAETLPSAFANAKDQSTCSDGSLLSMGSSDLDEDSCGQSSSRHSSKLSLQDKKSSSADGGDLEVRVSTTPLSHSAARHKMAVKPKRTHGAPRRKRIQQLSAPALPATPELNEEPSGRSLSPEVPEVPDVNSRLAPTAADDAAPTPAPRAPSGYQLKSASLPPGAALQRGPFPYGPYGPYGLPLTAVAKGSSGPGAVVTVTRSRSSAAARQQGEQSEHTARRSGSSDQLDRELRELRDHEQAAKDAKPKKDDLSFFGRLLSRRSGKKKKGERATEQPPAPVLPPSVAAATAPCPAPRVFPRDVVDAAGKEPSSLPCSLPTRRLDEKGRYVAETEVVTQAVPPGALVSHFLSRPRQRLEPMTITQRDADTEPDGEAEDDRGMPLLPRTTTPLDGVPIPVKPEPAAVAAAANRMQVSYSTSPPPPHWPASASAASAASATTETKVVEVIEKTAEARSLFEQERESRQRLPGLSAFQQRVAAQMAHIDDSWDLSSLNEDLVKERRGPTSRSEPHPLPPSLPTGLDKEHGVLKQSDVEVASLSPSEGEPFSGAPDSLESPPPANAVVPSEKTPDPKPDARATEASPASLVDQSLALKGKSPSVEGLESVQPLAKTSSSDSLRSNHQVTISITQRPTSPEVEPETHTVTVACVPEPLSTPSPPATPTPTPVTTPVTPSTATSPSSATAPTAVTLVNLSSPTKPEQDKPETSHRPNKDNDKTDKSDLPPEPAAEVAAAPTEQPPQRLPLSALRKSLGASEGAARTTTVPEFMRVQLNRVDSKPSVNVVLSTASGSPERGGRVLDPWSVEEMAPDAPAPAPQQPISLLGLRAKRASIKDDLVQPSEAAEDVVPISTPSTPVKSQPSAAFASPKQAASVPLRRQPPPVKRMLSEDNNNVIIVEKKQPKTPQQQEDAVAAIRRKSASRDSLQLQWQSSLEDNEHQSTESSRDSSISPVLDGVVLRKKSLPPSPSPSQSRDETPELMKVFARRSLKVRDSDGDLTLSLQQSLQQSSQQSSETNGVGSEPPAPAPAQLQPQALTQPAQPAQPAQPQQRGCRTSRDSDKENKGDAEETPCTMSIGLGLRFQRSISLSMGQERQERQEQPPSPRPSPPADKPTKLAKPITTTLTATPSNRLKTRKPDNLITNGSNNMTNNNNNHNNNNNNNNINATEKASSPPAATVVAKMSARWTLPAEAKPAPVVVATEGEERVVEGGGIPSFKRIQQRKEEWEQRAKALHTK